MHVCTCLKLPLLLGFSSFSIALEENRTEACDIEGAWASSERGQALLQVSSRSVSAVTSQAEINLSKVCTKLEGLSYVSGAQAPLDETGYQQTAQLCCHHEMSLFVRREIERQGFAVCDLSDLHGFVHWYDCSDDLKNFADMQAEIPRANVIECAWLGIPGQDCPVKGPNCGAFPPCPTTIPAGSLEGSSAPLTEEGYSAVRQRCCHVEMEQFVLREIDRQNLFVCIEGSLQGFLHWYDCPNDGPTQTYAKMVQEISFARLGDPCPWLGSKGEACPETTWKFNCPWIEPPEPTAHRRRTACR